jgi:dienelactone hydrolase
MGVEMGSFRRAAQVATLLSVLIATAEFAKAQATHDTVAPLLEEQVQRKAVTAYQIQQYLMKRIAKPLVPATSEQWSVEEQKLRRHILRDIVYHGWPQEWIDSAPRFEQTDVIQTTHGYRVRKYRYEIVPGFESTALLYEPEQLNGRVPAILNLTGHEPLGNLTEYEQKRCINLAKRGILALSLGWPGLGELGQQENNHDFAGQLDLVGSNSLGYFYLVIRRGLDFLATLPNTDQERIGVTGLSGGGWQTVMISSLDERVKVMVEVAGIGSLESNLARPTDSSDVEEDATDLMMGFDYPFLVAMRAPRPTLLIHNEQDDCCFLASLVKPYVYEQILPFFRLYQAETALRWHENVDPGTHNYQLDNRQQAYAFFLEHFRLPPVSNEIPSDSELFTPQQLAGDLPTDNLTIAGLARKLAGQIHRAAIPAIAGRNAWMTSQREQLKSVIRYSPVAVNGAWKLISTKGHPDLRSFTYRFDFSNSLTGTGIWVATKRSATTDAPLTIVLNDKGYKKSAQRVADRVNRGEDVLAFEPLFFGSTSPDETEPAYWEMLVASSGERAVGLEVGQLIATAKSFRTRTGPNKVRLDTDGIRSQVVALTAAALEPDLFSEIESNNAMSSLRYLLDAPVPYRSAPDLFCLDLYKYFDIDRMAMLALPVKVTIDGKTVLLPDSAARL